MIISKTLYGYCNWYVRWKIYVDYATCQISNLTKIHISDIYQPKTYEGGKDVLKKLEKFNILYIINPSCDLVKLFI